MKYIKKRKSPQSFEEWKINKKLTEQDIAKKAKPTPKVYWEKLKSKPEIFKGVKNSILVEQGYICCYCQRGLEGNNSNENLSTSVYEHLFPKDIYPSKMFNYDNLLTSCEGGKKSDEPYETRPKWCDYHKHDEEILISPLNQNCEGEFEYIINFSEKETQILVQGVSDKSNKTIEVLNLNVPQLKNLRGAVISGLILENNELIDKEDIKTLLKYYQKEFTDTQQKIDNNEIAYFHPFCKVIIDVLKSLC
jgi:uncharacterized protein (TIGR02646 family)